MANVSAAAAEVGGVSQPGASGIKLGDKGVEAAGVPLSSSSPEIVY
jgi:hypothetical protein